MKRRVIVGISGASGVIYGVRALQYLHGLQDVETHLVITPAALTTLAVETAFGLEDLRACCDVYHRIDNLAASIASGSFRTHGMLIAPCSIKTLSGIANSYADTLLVRAADVALKERRRLVLMLRETPLHKGHLELMLRVVDYGAQLVPPIPAFYKRPLTLEQLVDQSVGRALDCLGIDNDLAPRWGEGG